MGTMVAARYDVAMLERARSGDRDAILSLLVAAQPDIRRYARRNCSVADDVDDAVQEALWLIYRRIGTLRALTSFSGWIFAVVRRECMRLSQRMLGRAVESDEADRNGELAWRPPVELRMDLTAAIQSLPEHYREIVLLRDIEEMTIDEISAALGRTRESTKAALHRARILLREYLQ